MLSAMRYLKDVEIRGHTPGRKLAEVVIRTKNERGASAKFSQAIGDSQVYVLTGLFNAS